MPEYRVSEQVFEISRQFALLDTNVLVHRFAERESHHSDMVDMFSMSSYQWIISFAVVQEAWSMILSRGGKQAAAEYYTWLLNPGSNLVLVPINDYLLGNLEVYNRFGVDCVDGALLKLAEDIGKKCNLKCIIATYDSKDFYTLWSQYDDTTFELYNMEEDYVRFVSDGE